MIPTLPRNDPDPARRAARLYASREHYRFAHLYQTMALPGGVAVAAEVPPREGFSPSILAQVMAVEATILANQALSELEGTLEDALADRPPRVRAADFAAIGRVAFDRRHLFAAPRQAARRIEASFPVDLSSYKRLFALIARPEIVGALDRGPEMADRLYSWQRLAGAGPVHIQGIRSRAELPERFALDDAIYRRVMGGGDSLEAAIAERRLYVSDYRLFEGVPDGTWGGGRKKYTFAPIAAFAWRRPTALRPGELVPIAIQCHQHRGGSEDNPVLTPGDGVRWQMARTIVQSTDGQAQELIHHLGRTHLVMEAATVAAHRSFADNHPLMVLLAPHCAYTLSINDHAVHSLIAPGGQVEQVFGKTLAGSLEVVTRALAETRLSDLSVPADLARRQVDDVDGLGVYPWRDDARELWPAMERFVRRYISLYYPADADVAEDAELRAFAGALAAPEEGNLRGVIQPTDLDSLTRLITTLVWTASAQHSCMNYAQFPMMGYVVNVPAAVYREAPTASTPDDPAHVKQLLPPAQATAVQFATLYELSSVRVGRLGEYPALHFLDPRVGPLLADYRAELDRAEAFMKGADATRLLSYPYLRPSLVGQSIYI